MAQDANLFTVKIFYITILTILIKMDIIKEIKPVEVR